MNRLEFLRKEKELSQSDIGNILGITPQAVGLYEKEKRDMTPDTIIKLSEYFHVTTDYLLGKCDSRNGTESNTFPITDSPISVPAFSLTFSRLKIFKYSEIFKISSII